MRGGEKHHPGTTDKLAKALNFTLSDLLLKMEQESNDYNSG
jgi:hypothetical protein